MHTTILAILLTAAGSPSDKGGSQSPPDEQLQFPASVMAQCGGTTFGSISELRPYGFYLATKPNGTNVAYICMAGGQTPRRAVRISYDLYNSLGQIVAHGDASARCLKPGASLPTDNNWGVCSGGTYVSQNTYSNLTIPPPRDIGPLAPYGDHVVVRVSWFDCPNDDCTSNDVIQRKQYYSLLPQRISE